MQNNSLKMRAQILKTLKAAFISLFILTTGSIISMEEDVNPNALHNIHLPIEGVWLARPSHPCFHADRTFFVCTPFDNCAPEVLELTEDGHWNKGHQQDNTILTFSEEIKSGKPVAVGIQNAYNPSQHYPKYGWERLRDAQGSWVQCNNRQEVVDAFAHCKHGILYTNNHASFVTPSAKIAQMDYQSITSIFNNPYIIIGSLCINIIAIGYAIKHWYNNKHDINESEKYSENEPIHSDY